MSDAAIVMGIRALWEMGGHIDCHIQVGDRRFPVHKVIISSVSDHFNTLLSACDGVTDSNTVQLDGISASVMENLIEFIYKGKMDITKANIADLLDGAKYLMMQSAVDVCVDFIMANLDVANCVDMLSVFRKHTLKENVKIVQSFVESNVAGAYEDRNPENISYSELCFVMDNWRDMEINLFLFVKRWVGADFDSRKKHVNALMGRIRFCLMPPAHLKPIPAVKMYQECPGAWRGLVDKATTYHNLPIHIMILNDSEQSTVRGKPAPTCFIIETEENGRYPRLYTLDEDRHWKIGRLRLPTGCHHVVAAIQINNFLLVCPPHAGEDGQEWWVFDPRSFRFSQLPSMGVSKVAFAVVYHGKGLYILGGLNKEMYERSACDTAEKYDLRTDTWSPYIKLPQPVMWHAACVFQDCIYLSGGQQRSHSPGMSEVYCLDLTDKPVWKSKAPLLRPQRKHQMCVMKLHGQEVICVLGDDFQPDYYNVSTNQWSRFTCSFSHTLPRIRSADTMIVDANMVFFYDEHDHHIDWNNAGECLQLTYPEDGDQVEVEYLGEHFSPYPDWNDRGLYAHGAVLTVPAHKLSTPKRQITKEPDIGSISYGI